MENSNIFWIIDEELNCHMIALPSAPPEANILELLDEYKQRMADLGCAFCFFMILLSLQMYK
jgi:hypothetical protein